MTWLSSLYKGSGGQRHSTGPMRERCPGAVVIAEVDKDMPIMSKYLSQSFTVQLSKKTKTIVSQV